MKKETEINDLLKVGDLFLYSTLTSQIGLNVNLVSKVLAERLKTALPSLISSNETAYLNGRLISKGGRLISDIFEVSHLLN